MDDVHFSCSSQSPSRQLAMVCTDSPCFRLPGKKVFLLENVSLKNLSKIPVSAANSRNASPRVCRRITICQKSNISSGRKGKETPYTFFWKLFAAHLCSCTSSTSCGERSHPHHSLNYMYRQHHEKIFAVRVPTSLLQPC